MRTHFVLIDSENVKLEYIEKLKHEHFKVMVFVGPHLKRLDFSIVHAVQSLGSNGRYIPISSRAPEALDLHIAFYIGKLAAAHPGACFHIISKDKGFDPLIKHLNDQQIPCSRSITILDIPIVKSTDKVITSDRTDKLPSKQITPKQRAETFYAKRIAPNKSRPTTVTTLQSAILSHFNKLLSTEEVAQVLKALIAAGRVVVNGKKVTYPNRP